MLKQSGVSVEKLPEYMIPSFFQRVKEFPITPNGKLDYSLLPKPSEIVDVNEFYLFTT